MGQAKFRAGKCVWHWPQPMSAVDPHIFLHRWSPPWWPASSASSPCSWHSDPSLGMNSTVSVNIVRYPTFLCFKIENRRCTGNCRQSHLGRKKCKSGTGKRGKCERKKRIEKRKEKRKIASGKLGLGKNTSKLWWVISDAKKISRSS